MGARAIDMTGQRFERILVLSRGGSAPYGGSTWNCRCDCGTERLIVGRFLRDGTTKSCGCIRLEHIKRVQPLGSTGKRTHGMSDTPTYQSWLSMRARCLNSNNVGYQHYGGRGITIDPRWDSFENFLADMGEKPNGLTLDRKDVNGNYVASNCRWATPFEQIHNRRSVTELQEELDMWKARALAVEGGTGKVPWRDCVSPGGGAR